MLLPPSPASPSPFLSSTMTRRLQSRAVQPRNHMVYIVLIAIIGSIIAIGIAAVVLRSIRARHPKPKLIPTSYLKNKWTNWNVPAYSARGNYQTTQGNETSRDPGSVAITIQNETTTPPTAAEARGGRRASARDPRVQVDRNTSMRSVMTLPPYEVDAREGEQVLGRGGERDGIDVVLEIRSVEEAEEIRNAEMEQLYQIRQLRRQWGHQREERRVQRREARARGDVVTLQRLREEATAAQDNTELIELRTMLEDIKSERDSRVSVVNYASVGVARHDGTRIRANSMESEQIGLLSDAEIMGQTSPGLGAARDRTSSLMTHSTAGHHRRTSSALSVEVDLPSPGVTRSRANSAAASRDASPSMTNTAMRQGSDASPVVDVDLGDEIPPHSPPGYEHAAWNSGGAASNTPIHNPIPSEPPPGYISREPSQATLNGAGLGISAGYDRTERRSSRGVGGVPQLPSLRLASLPQIIVQPSSNP